MGVEDILRAVDDTHAGQFGNGELGGLGVGHVPEIVTLVAEVFEADPDGIVDILDKVGAPVVEDLETTDLVTGILHVDPAIGHDGRVAERGDVGGVLEAHVLDEQSDGDEITVGQAVGDVGHVLRDRRRRRFGVIVMRRRIDGVDEVLDGHGRDELVGVQFGALAVRGLVDHGFDTALCLTNLDDLASVMTVAPASTHRRSTVSQSWPGPSLGYQNSSMSDVSTSPLRFLGLSLRKAFLRTPRMLRPLTRWAPQSAEICEG